MSYIEHPISFTAEQGRKLLNGHTVQFKPEQLGCGTHTIHLDYEQAKRFHTAHRLGKGLRVEFRSQHHLEHNIVHGKGFASLLSKAKQMAYKHLLPHAQKAYEALKPAAKQFIKDQVHELAPQARAAAHRVGQQVLDKGFDKAEQHLPSVAKYRDRVEKQVHNFVDQSVDQGMAHADHQLGEGINWGVVGRKARNTFKDIGKALAPMKGVGKQILKGVASVAIPAAATALGTAIGQPELGAIAAPIATSAANNAINGLGLKLKLKSKKGKKGGALVASGGALVPSGGALKKPRGKAKAKGKVHEYEY